MLLRTLYLWLVLLISSATASQKHLKTSSLLTCMDNSQFTASFFDVKFYPHNKTVIFKVDASTIINGKIVVKAELIAYGLKVLDKTFNLCSLNEVSLCPLASGRIDVSSSYQIDSDVTDQIPGIAYTIPDLDAQIRVVAYSEDDTDYKTPLACVQAILSNDKTVQTKYASWPIAAVSGLGLLTAGFVSVIGYSATSAHIASNSISLSYTSKPRHHSNDGCLPCTPHGRRLDPELPVVNGYHLRRVHAEGARLVHPGHQRCLNSGGLQQGHPVHQCPAESMEPAEERYLRRLLKRLKLRLYPGRLPIVHHK